MDATLATRLVLIEERQSVTQAGLASLSGDVREMKDALLRVLAGMEGQGDRHAEYDSKIKALQAAQDEQSRFMHKVIGVIGAVNFIGLPAVMFALMHTTK